jgi:hypothetical protein
MNLSSTNPLQRIRSVALTALLTLIYFLLLTPIAWLKRANRDGEIGRWTDPSARAGWSTHEQSTSQMDIYRRMS